jgi:hypothetical protein
MSFDLQPRLKDGRIELRPYVTNIFVALPAAWRSARRSQYEEFRQPVGHALKFSTDFRNSIF